jgi:hypothetical protein
MIQPAIDSKLRQTDVKTGDRHRMAPAGWRFIARSPHALIDAVIVVGGRPYVSVTTFKNDGRFHFSAAAATAAPAAAAVARTRHGAPERKPRRSRNACSNKKPRTMPGLKLSSGQEISNGQHREERPSPRSDS